jgi:hypothetical protein
MEPNFVPGTYNVSSLSRYVKKNVHELSVTTTLLGDVLRIKERLLDAIEPDSIVKLRNGSMILVEMKSAEFDMDHAKYRAARRWVSAVNNWGRLGRWDFMVCKDPLALPGMLAGFA